MLLIRGAMLPDFETGTTTQADVLIRDGRFAAIAPHLEADCPIVEASGLLMLPGMADLHTHMVQSLTQGPLDDLNITQWLTRMLRAQWSLTEDEWYYGVLLGCLRSIRYGVTAINEMTYYPHIDAVVQAYQDAGLRVTFGIGATDIAENDQIRVTPVDECLRQAEELYHKWHGRGLLRTAAVPQGRPACTPELMRALKQFARERGLLYHTHLAEGKAETERIRAWTGRGEAEELAHLGVLDESTPIAELLASGARVGFGCDGEASSANRDLLREARLGSYLQKVRTLDPTVLPAGQCYAMLTEQGMRALGYRDVGRIAEGWQADFSLVRTETLCTVNRRRILTNLLYAGSGEQIDSVYVQGRPLLRNGQFVHHDLEHILQRCEEITARIERTLA